MEVSFDIFIPKKKKWISTTSLLLLISILLILFYFILNYFSLNSTFIDNFIFITCFAIWIFFFLRAFLFKGDIEPLKGRLSGQLKIKDNNLHINQTKIDIEKVSKIDFIFGTYYSQPSIHNPIVSPLNSNGTNNWIIIQFQDGTKSKVQFQRMYEDQQKHLNSFFEYLYSMKKMPFLRLTELLGINDYKKIQEYKSKINL